MKLKEFAKKVVADALENPDMDVRVELAETSHPENLARGEVINSYTYCPCKGDLHYVVRAHKTKERADG